jgi:predicted CXXCH cytochrome family protein
VDCVKCHKSEIVDGKSVQKFAGLEFNNCNSCHKDAHQNKFGQNCKQCHTEESFHSIKGISNFDHDKTGYPLVGKHKLVSCKLCHKASLTTPIRYGHCTDCHADYHKKEFVKDGIAPDCNQCHDNDGFTESSFTIEKHNFLRFKLEGAHLATPCIACHKKQEIWTFRKIGILCVDCHKDEHKGFIQEKYYRNENCIECHVVKDWKTVSFDHSKTKFTIEGAHARQTCVTCHYPNDRAGLRVQKFAELTGNCSDCHNDSHAGQFDINGKTDCTKCHGFDDWKKSRFDHNSSRFKLEGAHLKVTCEKCHNAEANAKGKFILYKNNKILCSNCHQ